MRRTREDTRGAPNVLPIHQHKIGSIPFVAVCSLFVLKIVKFRLCINLLQNPQNIIFKEFQYDHIHNPPTLQRSGRTDDS